MSDRLTESIGGIHATPSGRVARDDSWRRVFQGRVARFCDSILPVVSISDALPDDIDALKAALLPATTRALQIEAELAIATARASDDRAMIAHQHLEIAKLRHQLYGQRSERSVRLLDQLALGFDELESSATADEIAAEQAAARTANVAPFTRKRPARQPFPEHLPRERVVAPAPTSCLCCGSARLRKLGEDVTETLEVIPRSWKVIQQGGRSSPAGRARR
jgi:transposase